MKRDRSDSGKGSRPRAAAGRKPGQGTDTGARRTVRPRQKSSDGAGGADKPGDAEKKKKAAPAARASKAKPAAKPAAPKARPAKPAAASSRGAAAKAEKPAPPPKAEKPAPAARATKPSRAAAAARPAAPPSPAPEKPSAPKKAAAAKPVAGARPAAARPAAARTRAARGQRAVPPAPVARKVEADVSDEERIESAKYDTGERPPRVFEEERFIFPETYGHNRVRLLVKDPQWLFAHWDVDPAVFSGLRGEMGERAAALSRLTLKVEDPEHGGGAVIHLPEDARSWYVRADRVRRAYRAELGLTLPSGEYRRLATSNTVRTPAGAASPRRASHRARYEGPRRPLPIEPAGEWPRAEAIVAPPAGAASPAARAGATAPGPWQPRLVETRAGHGTADDASEGAPQKGGASDVHRPLKPGASDLHRR